ncbi:hypothetical protein Amsp01_049980 [Amycolatopsis sp. NBRC 101858]|nr:hypothetical protein Amsp01_049980 [Amycolatopsis sp. NBRC 101858]
MEDACMQTAFFCSEELNAALERLLEAARTWAEIVRTIQVNSRPGFGGVIAELFQEDEESGRRRLDRAITTFVTEARADLGIEGGWAPPHPSAAD